MIFLHFIVSLLRTMLSISKLGDFYFYSTKLSSMSKKLRVPHNLTHSPVSTPNRAT